jgi:hypothetical protein
MKLVITPMNPTFLTQNAGARNRDLIVAYRLLHLITRNRREQRYIRCPAFTIAHLFETTPRAS